LQNLWQRWQQGELRRLDVAEPESIPTAGVPPRLNFVPPGQLSKRSFHTEEGKAALIHAIAHIEFNAINLALDAIYRFRSMPCQYYEDWLSVALEEAKHFQLIEAHLKTLGYQYGDFTVHNGLWHMVERTADDVLVRMALVPRVLEARGLDVTPGMIKRFTGAGDKRFAEILEIIEHDEIGHVKIGTCWFHYMCDQRGLNRIKTFKKLFHQYTDARVNLPLHREARLQAGFSEDELDYLEGRVNA